MVGVPRSTGCTCCRKSKVKCDEVRPLCGRCLKTKRVCQYESRFSFVNESDKMLSKEEAAQYPNFHLAKQNQPRVLLYTTEKRMKHGGLMQKWHRTIMPDSPVHGPPLSPRDVQIHLLIKCWDEGPKGMRFDLCAAWFRQLPSRLGKSVALDDAVQLLSTVHRLMLAENDSSKWVCPASYIKALRSLRKALIHPEEGYWVETLAASMILYHIEEKFGCPFHWNTLRHAGGVGKLLEMRGPVKFQDEFDWQIIGQIQGPVVAESVVLGKPCFLAEPKWQEYFDSFEPPSERGALIQELALQLSHWPNAVADVRKLRDGRIGLSRLEDCRQLVHQVQARLDALGVVIDENLDSDDEVALVPSRWPDSPVVDVYDFGESSMFPAMLNVYIGYTLILQNMSSFLDRLAGLEHLDWQDDDRMQRNCYLVNMACRIHEWAVLRSPMIAGVYVLSLTAAWKYAETDELKDWIQDALNQSDVHRNLAAPRYTPQTLDYLNKLFTGEVDLPTAPGSFVKPGARREPCCQTEDTIDESSDGDFTP